MLDHTKHQAPGKYFHKGVTIKKKKITNKSLKLFIIFEIALNELQKNADTTTKWLKNKTLTL